MAIRISHVVDESAHEEGTRLLSLLLRLLPVQHVEQQVAVIGCLPSALTVPTETSRVRVPRLLNWTLASTLHLSRVLRQQRPDVVLAWSADAAAAARMARCGRGNVTVLLVLCDPAEARKAGSLWRSVEGRDGALRVLCSSEWIQRRVVEAGIPADACSVIRPGVDFGELRQAKDGGRQRERLGLPAEGRILLTASPPSRAGGQFHAVWAVAILHQIWPDARLIIPGRSREAQRLRRMIEQLYCPQVFVLTGDRYSPAELLAASDMFLVPAIGDVSTGWLAWAMAAGVPIVGCAVPAVTELIADRHSGFLCKPAQPHTLATRIRTAFEARDVMRDCVETARGQAFDAFRAQRCVDAYLKVLQSV